MANLCKNYYQSKDKVICAVDREIREYIEMQKDEDFSEVIAVDNRWEIFYHLSPWRESILNWYEFGTGSNVLEIGGEFGAITGMLCEKCEHVTTVEEELFKAEAIEKRYSERKNLDIYVGNVLDIPFEKKFDFIIMIGSLERICDGSKEKWDYAEYVKRLFLMLNPQGRVLLAVDNRLGLRYFCGERENYTGRPFAGINHYPEGSKGYTFDRNEIIQILKMAEADDLKFYYPMPDYKMTQMIYTDEFLPQKDLGERLLFYHLDSTTLVASEQKLYFDIIDNNVFPFFSNSFLIECGHKHQLSTTVFATVTTDRGDMHGMATSIHFMENNTKVVKKAALHEAGTENLKKVYYNIQTLKNRGISVVPHSLENRTIVMPFVEEKTCSDLLRDIVKIGDKKRFERIFELLYEDILKSSEYTSIEKINFTGLDKMDSDIGVILKNCYIDMVPFNCFLINDKLHYFDQEFIFYNCPAKFPVYRAIMYTYLFIPESEKLIHLEEMKERYGLEKFWDIFTDAENHFGEENRRRNVFKHFYEWIRVDDKQILKNVDRLL